MDNKFGRRHGIAWRLLILSAIVLIVRYTGQAQFYGYLTKLIVSKTALALGIASSFTTNELIVGRVTLPWGATCDGTSFFTTLLAVAVLTSVGKPIFTIPSLMRLAMVWPISILINAIRVGSIILYRDWWYPAAENPQLHYAFGMICLLPCLGLYLRSGDRQDTARRERSDSFGWTEISIAAVQLTLLAPFVSEPGGTVVALATIWMLFRMASETSSNAKPGPLSMCLWILMGGLLAAYYVASLWIAWLFLCPALSTHRRLRSPTGIVILAGTVPLVTLLPAAAWAVITCLLIELAVWTKTDAQAQTSQVDAGAERRPGVAFGLATMFAVVLPFSGLALADAPIEPTTLPNGLIVLAKQDNGFLVRSIGQPRDFQLVWYAAQNRQRHHTLEVCMTFTGIDLQETGDRLVRADEHRWLAEFFVVDDRVLVDYRSYRLATLLPNVESGAHILAVAPRASMSKDQFRRLVEDAVERVEASLAG